MARDVAAEIERFILDDVALVPGTRSLARDDDLLATGVIDSHGLMEVVGFLEQRYGVVVDDDDLIPENFESLASIASFVERKAA